MTEGKPKRSYWRRGPRKKKGAEDAAGAAAATPQATEGEDPEAEAPVAPEPGESFAPPPAPEFGEEAFVDPPPPEASAEAPESVPAPPKGRRRSRRRGKKKPGDAPAQELSEESGETRAPVPPPAEEPKSFDVVGWGGLESPARAPYEAPAAAVSKPAEDGATSPALAEVPTRGPRRSRSGSTAGSWRRAGGTRQEASPQAPPPPRERERSGAGRCRCRHDPGGGR